jgi:hypothetical protein
MREKKVGAALLMLADVGGAREGEELDRAGSGRRRSLRRARHAPPP